MPLASLQQHTPRNAHPNSDKKTDDLPRNMDAAKETVDSVVGKLSDALTSHGNNLTSSLKDGGLVPGPAEAEGLIPADFKPLTKLEVSFAGKAVDLGNMFRAGECKTAPSISFQREVLEDSRATYTLMMVDPDAPTPDNPMFAFWRHWILTGLQPLSGDSSVVATTKFPVTAYFPPGPMPDSGPHRYLFLLFREPDALDLKKEDIGEEERTARRSFKPAEVVRKFGLSLVAVNWMRCVADDWKGE